MSGPAPLLCHVGWVPGALNILFLQVSPVTHTHKNPVSQVGPPATRDRRAILHGCPVAKNGAWWEPEQETLNRLPCCGLC